QLGTKNRSRVCAQLNAALLPGRLCGSLSAGATLKLGSHGCAQAGYGVDGALAAVCASAVVMGATSSASTGANARTRATAVRPERLAACSRTTVRRYDSNVCPPHVDDRST